MEFNSTNTIEESFDFPEPSVPVEVSWNRMNLLLDQEYPIKIISKPKIFYGTKFLSIIFLVVLIAVGFYFQFNERHFHNKYSKIDPTDETKIIQYKKLEKINHSLKVKSPVDTSLHENNTIRSKTEKFNNSLEGESILNKKGFPVIIGMRHNDILKSKSKDGIQNVKVERKVFPITGLSTNKLLPAMSRHSFTTAGNIRGYEKDNSNEKIKKSHIRIDNFKNAKKNLGLIKNKVLLKGVSSLENLNIKSNESTNTQMNDLNSLLNDHPIKYSVPIINQGLNMETFSKFYPSGIDSSILSHLEIKTNSVKQNIKIKNRSPFNRSNEFHLGLQLKISLSGDKYNFKNIHGANSPANFLIPQIIFGHGIGKNGILSLIINSKEQMLGNSNVLFTKIKTDTFPVRYQITDKMMLLKTQGIGITALYQQKLFNKVSWSIGIKNIYQQKALIQNKKDSSGQLILDSSFTIDQNKLKEHNLLKNIFSISPGLNYSFGKFMIGTALRIPVTPFSSKNNTSGKPVQGELYIRYYFK